MGVVGRGEWEWLSLVLHPLRVEGTARLIGKPAIPWAAFHYWDVTCVRGSLIVPTASAYLGSGVKSSTLLWSPTSSLLPVQVQ